ncbi:hypothetical protein PENTCL1PPCAC_27785, partial [Pristionchus entomophagus]
RRQGWCLTGMKFAMENGAATPTNTRQSRRNNMMIVPTGSPPTSPGPSSSRRRTSALPRPTMALPAGSTNSASAFLPPTASSAGINN